MIDSLLVQSLKTCQSGLEFCKSRLDPLKHQGLFNAVSVALDEVMFSLQISQLTLDYQLAQEAKEGNKLASLIVRDKVGEANKFADSINMSANPDCPTCRNTGLVDFDGIKVICSNPDCMWKVNRRDGKKAASGDRDE
jgi:hypothetical protein